MKRANRSKVLGGRVSLEEKELLDALLRVTGETSYKFVSRAIIRLLRDELSFFLVKENKIAAARLEQANFDKFLADLRAENNKKLKTALHNADAGNDKQTYARTCNASA